MPSANHDNPYGRKEQQAYGEAAVLEVRNASAQGFAQYVIFLTLRTVGE
jgi:hypothetical protein